MNIFVSDGSHSFRIFLPTGVVFNRGTLWLAKKYACRCGKLDKWGNGHTLPPEVMDAIFAEMRRIQKKHDRWELVDVQSSGGERIRIIL